MTEFKDSFTIALCYDFDGTLSPDNMQEYDFIPKLNKSPKEFWAEALKLAKAQDADEILSYMRLMCEEASVKRIKVTRDDFAAFGKSIRFFDGVLPSKDGAPSWFARINAYAARFGATVRHYIISSGIKEMIEGTPIAHEFHKIYASSFMYDEYGKACWPALAVNYTTKMQFLFRINKGIFGLQESINDFMPEHERLVPFKRMVYFGDGSTDIPAMKLVKTQGGYSIAVHNGAEKSAQEAANLMVENRVNYVAKADYSQGSQLAAQVERVIQKICAEYAVERAEGK